MNGEEKKQIENGVKDEEEDGWHGTSGELLRNAPDNSSTVSFQSRLYTGRRIYVEKRGKSSTLLLNSVSGYKLKVE